MTPEGSAARSTYSVLVDGRVDGDKHVCSLPGYNGEGTGDYHHVPNTVVRCNGCNRLYVWAYSSMDDNGYSDGWGWERLSSWRPKHRKARRFLRDKDRR